MALGGILLEPPRPSLAAVAALAAGLALWLASIAAAPPTAGKRAAPQAAPLRVRVYALAATMLASAATWRSAAAGEYTAPTLFFWLVALAAWLATWWPHRSRTGSPRPARPGGPALVPALAAVVAVGAFWRLHRIGSVPAEPTSDHAEKLLDLYAVRAGEHPIFFPRNTGREPGQFYFTTWLAELLGRAPDFALLTLGTALLGILAVPLVFLLARELAGPRAGLLAALLFAFSHWPVGVTRTGLRHGFGPLASAATLWLAVRYLRGRDRRDALLCGLAVAVGLHGYTAFRIVPAAVLAVLLVALADARGSRLRVAADGLLLTGTAAVASLPLLRYAADHPDLVWARTSSRLVDGAPGGTEAVTTLARNLCNAALAFHWRGDDASVTVERLAPFLDPWTGAALLGGVVLLAAAAVRGPDTSAAAALLALPVLLLASALNLTFPAENPSAARLGVAAPLVFAVAGIGLDRPLALALSLAGGRRRVLAALAAAVLAAGLGAAAVTNYRSYFHAFDAQYRDFIPSSSEVADAVRRLTQQGVRLDDAYVIGYPFWIDTRNVGFALGAPRWAETHGVLPGGRLPAARDRPLGVVTYGEDLASAAALRAAFPRARRQRFAGKRPGTSFDVWLVPPSR